MPDLLSQDELLALEEELAAQEAPVAAPSFGASPQVLPPGPSPEFLRRQAMSMRLPSGTGVAIGPEGIFTSVGHPPPSAEEQMMEQIRGQINAMEFKNANDALNAAIQFQHMREAARLRSSGTSEEQILQRLGRGLFYQQPNVLPNMMRETRPVPAPAVTNIGGVNVLRSGLRGERATAIPRTALKPEEFKPAIVELGDGERAVQLAPNRYQYLKPVAEKDTPPAVRERILKHQISQAQEAMQNLPTAILPKAREEKAKAVEALQNQIKEANDALKAMVETRPKSTPLPMPKTKAELKKDSVYQTPRGLATWNGEKFVIQ